MFHSHHLGWALTHTADFFEGGKEHGFFHLKMPFHFVQERLDRLQTFFDLFIKQIVFSIGIKLIASTMMSLHVFEQCFHIHYLC